MVHNFADYEYEINGREKFHRNKENVTASNTLGSTLVSLRRNSDNMLMECRRRKKTALINIKIY